MNKIVQFPVKNPRISVVLTRNYGVSETGICLDPPVSSGPRPALGPAEKAKTLQTRNTGRLFLCDDVDFDHAKHTQWFEYQGCIVTKTKISFEKYCGINGERQSWALQWDYRRGNYVG